MAKHLVVIVTAVLSVTAILSLIFVGRTLAQELESRLQRAENAAVRAQEQATASEQQVSAQLQLIARLKDQVSDLEQHAVDLSVSLHEVTAAQHGHLEIVTNETLPQWQDRYGRLEESSLALQELSTKRGRSLQHIRTNVGTATAFNLGCFQISANSVIDLNSAAYPPCFLFTGTVSTLTITNCKTGKYFKNKVTEQAFTGIRKLHFIHEGSSTVTITANKNTAGTSASVSYKLNTGTSTTAFCYSSSSNANDIYFQDDFQQAAYTAGPTPTASIYTLTTNPTAVSVYGSTVAVASTISGFVAPTTGASPTTQANVFSGTTTVTFGTQAYGFSASPTYTQSQNVLLGTADTR
mmetsp:Transcript_23155/g.56315  ORF Transcript_23155/g.56315 Transcript_23155/m.56315 type:complete len:352 (-) Transcript_23155:157-1212(-)